MFVNSFTSVAALAAVTVVTTSSVMASIIIPTVPVGNAGNAPDPQTFNFHGSVAYAYSVGQTEVTNAQYAAFLNAKAASDPNGLYNANSLVSHRGITRSGSAGSYTYAPVAGRANHPVNYVSFWDATRFANWLHNGQGNGDTETGAYTLTASGISANTITRNASWQWAVTSESEWYKAAYHQPASAGGDRDNYWQFPTSSNSLPTTAQVNYSGNGINNTTPVGSYASNYYGTFDMGGNVFEWNEAIMLGSNRGIRGGAFNSNDSTLRAGNGNSTDRWNEFFNLGFRVSHVPGPSSAALMAIGGLAVARRRR